MKKIAIAGAESRPGAFLSGASPLWETLEMYARREIQQFVQRLLEQSGR